MACGMSMVLSGFYLVHELLSEDYLLMLLVFEICDFISIMLVLSCGVSRVYC